MYSFVASIIRIFYRNQFQVFHYLPPNDLNDDKGDRYTKYQLVERQIHILCYSKDLFKINQYLERYKNIKN